LALIISVIFSSFYLDSKSVGSDLIMSGEAVSEQNTQIAVPANNSAKPENSESDFEPIVDHRGQREALFFLSSNQRRGVLAEKLFSQSKNHRLRQFTSDPKMESCVLYYIRPESRLKIRDFLNNLSLWLRDDLVTAYSLDPDDSSKRFRPDEFFVIDCNFFQRALRLIGLYASPRPKIQSATK
jgi:hypothetical protein